MSEPPRAGQDPDGYPEAEPQPRYPVLEEQILELWREAGTFACSVKERPEEREYVFYYGPPFANGLPHYGHLLTGFVKDAIPRYQTMRGMRVERRFGWDCHGLPAEMEAEKELGVSGRAGVIELGVDRFNDRCRAIVQRTTDSWEWYVGRQARWVDFENDYKTMDLDFMESVMWAFKRLHELDLVYEGFRVLPFCWVCETPLSNFETRLDDSYRDRTDPAVTVIFDLEPLVRTGAAGGRASLRDVAGGSNVAGGSDVADTPGVADVTNGATAAIGATDATGALGAGGVTPDVSDVLTGPLRVPVWTTTPWTLPSNLALAVGPDIDYAVVELPGGERFVVGEARRAAYEDVLAGGEVVAVVKGSQLVGRSYRPLFPYFAGARRAQLGTAGAGLGPQAAESDPGARAFTVLAGDFVATDEGTGVVHMAPGFGEDDQRTCEAAGIAVVCPVDETGRFTAEVADYAGAQVFEANAEIVSDLDAAGLVARVEQYVHSYPHCWRTDTPLIYRAVSSWFVRVTELRDRMLELNQQIHWVPEHVRDGAFGKWLEGARDWSLTRNRFWGSPIPVWKSDDPAYPRVDIYGSLDEMERDFGVRPDDLHRPNVDALVRPNPDDPTGRSMMRRVPDILDCWFESGSMPFAQLHYPFENVERFETHFPADFIVEYVGQTRCWFYTLHVLATALFDRPPFRHCIAHGVVLGNDGRKLSKRLKNYPDPEEIFATEGADAMRWYFLSSPVLRGQDVIVETKAVSEAVRQVLNPIWNAWRFLSGSGRADHMRGRMRSDQLGVMDRYILAKARVLVEQVTAALDDYDLATATTAITGYLDALTNWYIRRSRDRFWRARAAAAGDGAGDLGTAGAGDLGTAGAGDQDMAGAGDRDMAGAGDRDKADAYDTLHTVLAVLCRAAAPLLPFLTERVYRDLTGEESVHLKSWPNIDHLPDDRELVEAMERVRDVCSEAHSIRKANRLRARLPLRELVVGTARADRLAPFAGLIAEEVNVKEVRLTDEVGSFGETVLSVVPAALGPRLGAGTQRVIDAAKRNAWSKDPSGHLLVGDDPASAVRLEDGEFTLALRPWDPEASRALPGDAGVVWLDLTVTPELEAEGAARDVVRLVQQARKDAGFEISDRIAAELSVPESLVPALAEWRDHIAEQILAVSLQIGCLDGAGAPDGQGGAGDAAAAEVDEVEDADEAGPPGETRAARAGRSERPGRFSVVAELPDGRPVSIAVARAG